MLLDDLGEPFGWPAELALGDEVFDRRKRKKPPLRLGVEFVGEFGPGKAIVQIAVDLPIIALQQEILHEPAIPIVIDRIEAADIGKPEGRRPVRVEKILARKYP